MMNFNFTAYTSETPAASTAASAAEEGARRAYENLSRLAARYTFVVGTCSLLHPQFHEMMNHLVPMLRDNGKQLILPDSVIGDLQRLVMKNPAMTDQVNDIIGLLADLRMQGLVQVVGNGSEPNSRKQIRAIAEELLQHTEPLIITQNNAFSEELVMLNRVRPSYGSRLAVSRVNHYGFLSRYIPQPAAMPQPAGLDLSSLSALTGDLLGA